VGSNSALNKYRSIFLIHTASLLVALVAMYYASTLLWAMDPCLLLDQEIIVGPKLKKYSEVLFQSTVLPIQFEFVKP